jgi:hypothetical protein
MSAEETAPAVEGEVPVTEEGVPDDVVAAMAAVSLAEEDVDDEKDAVAKEDVKLELSGTAEFEALPFGESRDRFLFMSTIKAPYFRSEDRAPIDLVAVIDESGSMAGDPITLVKETVSFIIDNLETNDRFAVIGYHSTVETILPLTKMDTAGKAEAQKRVEAIRDQGMTALCGGLHEGVKVMRARKGEKNDVASVMLFTDGQANVGPDTALGIVKVLEGRETSSPGAPPVPPKSRKMKMMKKSAAPAVPVEPALVTTGETPDSPPPMDFVINTFGFGANHNASLLQGLAEYGRGMYAFIERKDQIADTFAECLGGLVSTVAQSIEFTLHGLSDDVRIVDVLSKGYKVVREDSDALASASAVADDSVRTPSKVKIAIPDLQSEERRDIVVSISVPAVGAAVDKYPLIGASVKYRNCVREIEECLECVTNIQRIDGIDIGERDYQLDLQFNRLEAARVMEEADRLAESGKLDEARAMVAEVQTSMKGSKSQDDDQTKRLIAELDTVKSGLRSRDEYKSTGSKVMKMSSKAHYMQRAVQSSAYEAQSSYGGRKKKSMKKKFKK